MEKKVRHTWRLVSVWNLSKLRLHVNINALATANRTSRVLLSIELTWHVSHFDAILRSKKYMHDIKEIDVTKEYLQAQKPKRLIIYKLGGWTSPRVLWTTSRQDKLYMGCNCSTLWRHRSWKILVSHKRCTPHQQGTWSTKGEHLVEVSIDKRLGYMVHIKFHIACTIHTHAYYCRPRRLDGVAKVANR